MIQPLQKNRFANARAALATLKPLDVIRVAGVDFSETVLEFKANRLGEKQTQSITVENPISDTLLQGRWEVAPHLQDPPHVPNNHAWIGVTPAKFTGNRTVCLVHIDTSKLMADKQYKRQLILHSNAYPATHTLTVKVHTAALPIQKKRKIPYGALIRLFLMAMVVAVAMTWFITYGASLLLQAFGYEWILSVSIVLLVCGSGMGYWTLKRTGSVGHAVSLSVSLAVGLAVLLAVSGTVSGAVSRAVGLAVLLAVGWPVSGAVLWLMNWVINLAKDSFTTVLILLILGFGASVGTGIIAGFLNPLILLTLTGTSLPALSMLLYSPLKRRKLIAKYRQSQESLIKP
ncbi:hypothetical protein [Atlanticothrix silvestris]|uniref:hypothetical protein n=1 Tax=Atlanticothrix silvestris TaxID=2840444 RepID=UPI001CED2D42|nr:hypothetical protein [Atlanticothrix silvestris]